MMDAETNPIQPIGLSCIDVCIHQCTAITPVTTPATPWSILPLVFSTTLVSKLMLFLCSCVSFGLTPLHFFFFAVCFLHPILAFTTLQIPDELPAILKEYTKEVIRAGVSADEVIQWSAKYFADKAAEQAAAAAPPAE